MSRSVQRAKKQHTDLSWDHMFFFPKLKSDWLVVCWSMRSMLCIPRICCLLKFSVFGRCWMSLPEFELFFFQMAVLWISGKLRYGAGFSLGWSPEITWPAGCHTSNQLRSKVGFQLEDLGAPRAPSGSPWQLHLALPAWWIKGAYRRQWGVNSSERDAAWKASIRCWIWRIQMKMRKKKKNVSLRSFSLKSCVVPWPPLLGKAK